MKIDRIERIDIDSCEFPQTLREIPSPPKQLYYAGDWSLVHQLSVAIVGSRKYTLYGKNVAEMLGRKLSDHGIPVTSGLAYGIDSFAHRGVVDAGGKIIGVLGSGINKMSPKKNYDLMMRGLELGGLIISEYEPDQDATKYTFPARNRIISGISTALVLVEANFNSGSLITCKHAIEQGRTVYAVPGNITSQFSMGSNLMIRDGAIPLIVLDDLIRNLGISTRIGEEQGYDLGESELVVYEAVAQYDGVSPDTIATRIGRTPAFVSSIVTVLEVKGAVTTFSGKIFLAK